jgi:hypothetical protein
MKTFRIEAPLRWGDMDANAGGVRQPAQPRQGVQRG